MTDSSRADMDAMLDEVLDELDDDDEGDSEAHGSFQDRTDPGISASSTRVKEEAETTDPLVPTAKSAPANLDADGSNGDTDSITASLPNKDGPAASVPSPADAFQQMLRGFVEAEERGVVDGHDEITGHVDVRASEGERLGHSIPQVQAQPPGATAATPPAPTERPAATDPTTPQKQEAGPERRKNKTGGGAADGQVHEALASIVEEMARANVRDPQTAPGTGTPPSEEERLLQGIFQSLAASDVDGLDGMTGPDGEIPPDFNADAFMDGMMEQLLSKELMYEPMKQVAEKFPAWLAAHKGKLTSEEFRQRERQYECFRRLVEAYESSSDGDQQGAQTGRLMELMQQIQEFGQPPAEIVSEIAPGLELDDDGLPKMDGLPFGGGGEDGECRVM